MQAAQFTSNITFNLQAHSGPTQFKPILKITGHSGKGQNRTNGSSHGCQMCGDGGGVRESVGRYENFSENRERCEMV